MNRRALEVYRCLAFLFFLLLPLSLLNSQKLKGIKEYRVKEDLSNIANLKEFSQAAGYYSGNEFRFTDAQKKKLVENGFVVVPGNAEQFFHIYESSHFGISPRIPNFITTDCVLQLYHLFYDFTLREVEVEELLPILRRLTIAMLNESKRQYRKAKDPLIKRACSKNISFFGVATNLLKFKDTSIPLACKSEIKSELQKINLHSGREKSSIFPYHCDYSQFTVRGHYTRNEELRRFFLAMMWYSQNPFPFKFKGKKTREQVLQALLITHALFNSKLDNVPLIRLWDKIYSITSLYVGAADDIIPHDLKKLIDEIYGENVDIGEFVDKGKMNLLYKEIDKLPYPAINPRLIGIPQGPQFRFMPQRYIPDSYIMQKLTSWPARPWPKGLDVMAVLGSREAERILDSLYKEPEKWSAYTSIREELKSKFDSLSEDEWFENLFYGWLYTLNSLLEKRNGNYPSFMMNRAWEDKELNTALASWAEMRHDVVLYGKPSGAEGGGGGKKIPQPKGYVEPVPDFYEGMIRLVRLNRKILSDEGCLTDKLKGLFDRFDKVLTSLLGITKKELKGMPLTHDEYEWIRYFGSKLEGLSTSLVELGRNLPSFDWEMGKLIEKPRVFLRGWFEVTGPDRDVACIADVHTSEDRCLEEAVGHINPIYVVVPINGELYLTRGGVFSYYEFKYPVSHRLTDEAWQEMLKRGRAPELPTWVYTFMAK